MPESPRADRAAAAPFFTGYRPAAGVYDELHAPDGSVRPHWAYLAGAFGALGAVEFAQRWREARRVLREHGVTYNVYDDPQRSERLWALDPIPVLLTSPEWQTIEQGLAQRAELLELILADLYGPHQLVRRGLIPAEVIYAHPGFGRPCVGVPPPRGRHLPLYAADLARQPDGSFCVIGDRTQAPSGAGYALENRTVLSRILPSIFRDSHVHRLPLFFRRLRATLAALAGQPEDTPHLVLLTPGSGNETYFEHAYLASYLGCTLVQGDDLTVRDQRVWLRTLEGLRPVDVILRRVDGAFCDPLEMRGDSLLGVPGLLQAARQGHVAVVNPLGSSVVENPGLMAYLPQLARELLGEDLKLPSAPSWWCGDPAGREHVLANLDRLVVKPIFPHGSEATIFGAVLDDEERAGLVERIQARPHHYVGQEHLPLSTVPVVADGRLEPRAMLLRGFLAADGEGYTVMPGGLCRVAPTCDSGVVSNQRGGISKDVWVLASEPEREISLLTPADRPLSVVRGGQEVPWRVADNLFWAGRYAERAEGSARVLREVLQRVLDLDAAPYDPHLPALLRAVTQVTTTFPGFIGSHAAERVAGPETELRAVLYDGARTGSLRFNLHGMVRASRAVRDRLSSDTWRVIAALDREFAEPRNLDDALDHLDRVLLLLAAFGGLSADSMSRGQRWRFLEIGRRLERAHSALAVLRTLCPPGASAASVPWEALLTIADASMTYRRRYRAAADPGAVLDLLLDDETNPRSVLYQLLQLEALLDGLAGSAAAAARGRELGLASEALAACTRLSADGAPRAELAGALAAFGERLRADVLVLGGTDPTA
ncbi:MAG: circularly permuted type 2 ATP-grasp protein, partial [Candidatus Binatia bacterium]